MVELRSIDGDLAATSTTIQSMQAISTGRTFLWHMPATRGAEAETRGREVDSLPPKIGAWRYRVGGCLRAATAAVGARQRGLIDQASEDTRLDGHRAGG